MSAFLCRGLILVLGYAYPAYQCYKTLKFSKTLELKSKAVESNSKVMALDQETVELHKAEMEKLRLWCQYWVLVALVAVLERFGDVFISWLPCYHEAKLAFYLYLFYPERGGTSSFYEDYFSPYIGKYEDAIDENLNDLKPKAKDIVFEYSKKAFKHLQPILSQGFNKIVYYQLSHLPREQKIGPQLLSAMLPAPPAAPLQHSQETSVPPDPQPQREGKGTSVPPDPQPQREGKGTSVPPDPIKRPPQVEEEKETSVPPDPIKRQPQEEKQEEETDSLGTATNILISPSEEPSQIKASNFDEEDSTQRSGDTIHVHNQNGLREGIATAVAAVDVAGPP